MSSTPRFWESKSISNISPEVPPSKLASLAKRTALQREEQLPSQELKGKKLSSGSYEGSCYSELSPGGSCSPSPSVPPSSGRSSCPRRSWRRRRSPPAPARAAAPPSCPPGALRTESPRPREGITTPLPQERRAVLPSSRSARQCPALLERDQRLRPVPERRGSGRHSVPQGKRQRPALRPPEGSGSGRRSIPEESSSGVGGARRGP